MATVNDVLNIAKQEIGVTESGINNVKYNTEYYGGDVNGSSFDWCVVFLWWVFKKANASNLFCNGKKTAYVPYVVSEYTKQNALVTDGKPGDLAIITFNGHSADHIGIIESVEKNTILTIEGNTSGSKGEGVYRKIRKKSEVLYIFRPKYEAEKTEGTTSESTQGVVCKVNMKQISYGSKGAQVKTLQRIMYCYFGCPSELKIDGNFGTITKKYCIKLQAALGIAQDGICGVDTWTGALNLG